MTLDLGHNNGFEIFRHVFSADEIEQLRGIAIELLPSNSPPFSSHVENNIFDQSLELTELILGNQKLRLAISAAHGGEFVLLDEFSLHDSVFGGWHTDTTTPEINGLDFHLSKDFLLVQWAVYLQSNSIFGGGLSAKAGTHSQPDPFAKKAIRYRNSSALYKFVRSCGKWVLNVCTRKNDNYLCNFAIQSEVGDLVGFNLRIHHRATPYQVAPNDDSNRKLAIFFITGSNNASTAGYRDWINAYHGDKRNGSRYVSQQFVTFCESQGIVFLQ